MISRYKELRQQALERPRGLPHGQGLALFMRSGMCVWMQAWAHCVVQAPTPPKERLGEDEVFPLEMHNEVTMILAAMVLNGRREATA
ncbi:MAG: hypothetical protein ACYCRH_11190 [Acidiferrobacteraceae bacterium]